MSTENYRSVNIFPFDEVWERILSSTEITNQTELAVIVGVKQSSVSNRRSKNVWPEEWAYRVASRYGLLTEWILTGEGPRSLRTLKEDSYSVPILQEIDEWLSGLIVNQPERRHWFSVEFEDRFPMFREWKKRKEEEQSKGDSHAQGNIA